MAGRRQFGYIEKLPSGRYRAMYHLGMGHARAKAPTTFRTKAEAGAWLAREQVRLEAGASGSPKAVRPTAPLLKDYVERWLRDRPVRPSTRVTYRRYLDLHILPVLGPKRLDEITADVIRAWHNEAAPDAPTVRSRAYAFLKTVLGTAVEEDLIAANPCRIRGASSVRPATEVVTATPTQVAHLAAAVPETYAVAILLGAWCQLRVGECLALRRRDVDTAAGVIHVRRGVTWQDGAPSYGPPKTAAGVRSVHMPPFVVAAVDEHIRLHANPGRDGLLFPAAPGADRPVHLSTFSTEVVKRGVKRTDLPPTFRFHHLRHTGLSLLAESGASMAELQARAGHATAGIAMRYQHARAERDRSLAERLGSVAQPSPSS
jgi:integrase